MICSTTSPRAAGFTEFTRTSELRTSFLEHLFNQLGMTLLYGVATVGLTVEYLSGPSLETDLMHTGRTVFGDKENDNKPLLPPLRGMENEEESLHESRLLELKLTQLWSKCVATYGNER